GYHGGKEPAPAVTQSAEPPLAQPAPKQAPKETTPPRIQAKPVSQPASTTPATPAINSSDVPKPLPSGPPLVPTEAPRLKPAPSGSSLLPPRAAGRTQRRVGGVTPPRQGARARFACSAREGGALGGSRWHGQETVSQRGDRATARGPRKHATRRNDECAARTS